MLAPAHVPSPRPQASRRQPSPGVVSARSCLPPGVDHVDVAESRGHAAVTDCVDLRRLPFAVVECSTEEITLLSADHVHRIPEIRCAHLIRNVLQHTDNLSSFDFIEHLSAELRVVSLLIDRE